ncbi:MAG TPA: hypothetical protein VGN34_24305 [Ktedonobacteraceae bacterium]|jgi:hypothetical protein
MWKSILGCLACICGLFPFIVSSAPVVAHASEGLIHRSQTRVLVAAPLKSSEVPNPNYTILESVSPISKNDIWTAGFQSGGTDVNPWNQPLLKHWDGSGWHNVTFPTTEFTPNFYSIQALNAKSVYVAGYANNASYIAHWDGTNWQTVYTGPRNSGILLAIAAIDANDIWAVGDELVHWDGKVWQRFNDATALILRSIAVINKDDIWAVGNNLQIGGPAILHWNGKIWSSIVPPALGTDVVLNSITAPDKKNIWISGQNRGQIAILHWNGHDWQYLSRPSPGVLYNRLLGITAKSEHDIWAVGSTQMNTCTFYCAQQTLIEHWNGLRWQVVKSPDVLLPGNVVQDNVLYGVAALHADDVWAVGTSYAGYKGLSYAGNTLIEHWDGQSWQIIPSAG